MQNNFALCARLALQAELVSDQAQLATRQAELSERAAALDAQHAERTELLLVGKDISSSAQHFHHCPCPTPSATTLLPSPLYTILQPQLCRILPYLAMSQPLVEPNLQSIYRSL